MRELAVCYCIYCGYYGFYQSAGRSCCPNCKAEMNVLGIPYRDFIQLDYEERDELVAEEILRQKPSIMDRIRVEQSRHDMRKVVARLMKRVEELETENKKLNDTVLWMHQTIWDLVEKEKQKR